MTRGLIAALELARADLGHDGVRARFEAGTRVEKARPGMALRRRGGVRCRFMNSR